MNDYEIIEIFKTKTGLSSDYKAATKLGVGRAYISNVKNNHVELSENVVRKMIKLAGESGEAIADAWAKRSKARVLPSLHAFIPAFWLLSSIGLFSSKAEAVLMHSRIMDIM